ncbi:MAG TPA: phenylalanine--tRNA ligase subunit beta, partial [Pyrinomonadaceae bacterium]|nr:phenylalanine--tRNA ligase subunit beta [Pyrinomonadaceae bacterium]
SAATRDVLIESAYFAPDSVRRTSQVLGLSTDASYRFERGVDREGAARALERCIALICEIAGGTATADAIDVYSHRHEPPTVRLRFARVKSLAALDVQPQESVRILNALGFASQENGDADAGESASFVAPTWRGDVELEEDLVEEVARHVGYDKIAETLPASNNVGEYRAGDARRRAARQALTAQGFDEAVSFSFISTEHDGHFELLPRLMEAGEDESARLVTLKNPIIEGVTRMRPTLLPGLLDAVRHNMNHGTRNVRLFELGQVFIASAERGSLPEERTSFALVVTGGAVEEGRAGAVRELDFYDLKGALEAAVEAMKAGPLDFEATGARHLREGQSARVSLAGSAVGTIGRLGEELTAAYKFRQPVFVAEIDFSELQATPETPVRYMPLARYPPVVRDISLLVERRVGFAELQRAALALGLAECKSVSLVDVFEGAHVPEGKRSVTLRIEYRADERTLRDEEVESLHARVLQALETNFGAQLRG